MLLLLHATYEITEKLTQMLSYDSHTSLGRAATACCNKRLHCEPATRRQVSAISEGACGGS